MKNLNDYAGEELDSILEANGAFFAFNPEQFDRQARQGVKYKNLSSGLLCPVDNALKCTNEMNNVIEKARRQRLKEYTKEEIIHYELSNYECYYTGEIDDAVDALEPYGINREEIAKVYHDTKRFHYDD